VRAFIWKCIEDNVYNYITNETHARTLLLDEYAN